jgi:hypothetical protein
LEEWFRRSRHSQAGVRGPAQQGSLARPRNGTPRSLAAKRRLSNAKSDIFVTEGHDATLQVQFLDGFGAYTLLFAGPIDALLPDGVWDPQQNYLSTFRVPWDSIERFESALQSIDTCDLGLGNAGIGCRYCSGGPEGSGIRLRGGGDWLQEGMPPR